MRKTILRGVLLALVCCALLVSLVGCGEGYYDPIKSSSLERTKVFETQEYEVAYELVRYVFMAHIDEFDGGDRSLWAGENASTLWQTAWDKILPELLELYATFDICKTWGIDPYGDAIDNTVEQYIKADIDGGYVSGQYIEGLGSVDAYKEALAKTYSTDAVRRLYYRYSACLAALYSYVVENGAEGKVSVTDDQLLSYLAGDDYAHINRVYIPFINQPGDNFQEKRQSAYDVVSRLRSKLLLASSYDEMVRTAFINSYSTDGAMVDYDQAEYGLWLGKYTTDSAYNRQLYDVIFSIKPGEISDIIETSTGFYVVYGMEKDTTCLDIPRLKEMVRNLYVEEGYNKQIFDQIATLKGQITYGDIYDELTGLRLVEGT